MHRDKYLINNESNFIGIGNIHKVCSCKKTQFETLIAYVKQTILFLNFTFSKMFEPL